MSSDRKPQVQQYSDVQAAIILKLKMMSRPFAIDELMPLCMPTTPHSVNERTGCIVFDRPAFCAEVDDLVRRFVLKRIVDQMLGRILYAVA